MTNFPQKLIESIEKNKLIIWVGSGYSHSLGFPKWNEFILKISQIAFEDDPVTLQKFLEKFDGNQRKEKKSIEQNAYRYAVTPRVWAKCVRALASLTSNSAA